MPDVIAPPPLKYYFTLTQVYEDIHLNRRISGIAHAFGKKAGQAMSTTPRIRWEPTRDRYKPAEMGGEPTVLPGPSGANELVIIEEFDRRDAGVTILFYADSSQQVEQLAVNFRGALADVLRADRNYSAPDGEIIEPADESSSTWCYRMPLTVRLICADLYPATSPTNEVGQMGSTS